MLFLKIFKIIQYMLTKESIVNYVYWAHKENVFEY